MSGPVVVEYECARLDWSPRLVIAMLTRGLIIAGRRVPRRRVLWLVARAARAWWDWAGALPGDRFWHMQCDQIVEVLGGTIANRRVAVTERGGLPFSAPAHRRTWTWCELHKL